MSDFTYRPATTADAATVAAVIKEVFAGPTPIGFDHALNSEEVRGWIERLGDQGAMFVAERNGEIAGFGALDFNTQQPDTATLGVWQRSEFRRQGIGTALAECLLEHARARGFKKIVGRLPENNEAALSFLSSIGGLVPIFNPEMHFELPL